MTAPVRARSLRIARIDSDGFGVTGWTDVGHASFSFEPVYQVEPVAPELLTHRSTSVTIAVQPSRALRRLLLGPRWAWDRRRARTVTRRKALARRGRQ